MNAIRPDNDFCHLARKGVIKEDKLMAVAACGEIAIFTNDTYSPAEGTKADSENPAFVLQSYICAAGYQ